VETAVVPGTTWVRRWWDDDEALICLHTDDTAAELPLPRAGGWAVAVDTSGALAAAAGVSGSVRVTGRCALVLLRGDDDG
jgi:hypothetical protein